MAGYGEHTSEIVPCFRSFESIFFVLMDYMGHIRTEEGGTCVGGLYGAPWDRGRLHVCRWTIWGTLGKRKVVHV